MFTEFVHSKWTNVQYSFLQISICHLLVNSVSTSLSYLVHYVTWVHQQVLPGSKNDYSVALYMCNTDDYKFLEYTTLVWEDCDKPQHTSRVPSEYVCRVNACYPVKYNTQYSYIARKPCFKICYIACKFRYRILLHG